MANPYYTPSGNPGTNAAGASAPMRSEFTALSAAFDKLPVFTGSAGQFVVVNAGATGLSLIAGLTFTMNAFTVGLVANANATLQLPAASGTLALTSDVATLIAAATAGLRSVIQKFIVNGTYTPTANMVFCIIEMVGGGGGGGSTASGSGVFVQGGGGGSGSYSRKKCIASDIGASKAVTIGTSGAGGVSGANAGSAGGDTSVGVLCIAKGGSGGAAGTTGQPVGAGGAGGVAGTGDWVPPGNTGGPGMVASITSGTPVFATGYGAPSMWGGMCNTVGHGASAIVGQAAAANSGAGGAAAWTGNTSNAAGGAGGTGFVLITEFLSA